LIVVNKADGVLKTTAQRTCADYAGALRLMRKRPTDPAGFPKAMTVSAQEGEGLDTTWAAIGELAKWRRDTGIWSDTRQKQALAWFKSELQMGLVAGLNRDPALATLRDEMAEQVKSGAMTPDGAAARVLAELSAR
jgi:LAO/AO transport system kinase